MSKGAEVTPQSILEASWQGDHTVPVPGTYPHQWFTDSAMAAIGWSHIEPMRGATEITTLLDKGQWANGMVPHQIYSDKRILNPLTFPWDKYMWWHGKAPSGRRTSAITQAPMLAEAVSSVAQNLEPDERQAFLKEVAPRLKDYHEWLYRERDFGGNGLVATVHPYESGMNYTPYWTTYMQEQAASRTARTLGKLPIEGVAKAFRPDKLNDEKRFSITMPSGVLAVSATLGLGRLGSDTKTIRDKWPYQLEEVLFNSVLIRNNRLLVGIAREAGIDLPDHLKAKMEQTEANFGQLYFPAENDKDRGAYYSRTVTGQPLKILTIGSLAAVYSGILPAGQLNEIEDHLHDKTTFGLEYPIPTVPADNEYFNHDAEDNGGVKPQLNWLIAKGLFEAGRKETARRIAQSTIAVLESPEARFAKAYSPLTSKPLDKNRSAAAAGISRDVWSIASAPLILLAAFKSLLRKAA